MKIKNKKYVYGFSLLSCLAIGGLFEKPIMARLYPSTISLHFSVIGRDFAIYSKEADVIIVGKVAKVGNLYFNEDNSVPQRDVAIDVDEVIKGDSDMTEVTAVVAGGQIGQKKVIVEDEARLKPGEKVLLFLGTNNFGEHVVFAGSYGKYLIHEDNQVTSIGDFVMDLNDLKSQIRDELENGEPSPLVTSVPIEDQQ